MKQGDFTTLAKSYANRVGYNPDILTVIVNAMNPTQTLRVADVGAGTGKLTKQLLERKMDVKAVEPNDSMREEGVKYTKDYPVKWIAGSAEETSLEDQSVDWVTMASSFHWTDPNRSLPEFSRILQPGGFLTVMWNHRNIEASPLHLNIEEKIHKMAPGIKRKSSGGAQYTKDMHNILTQTGHFERVIFMEGYHEEEMSLERYMGAWESVNDIPAQVGEQKWQEILSMIRDEIKHLDTIIVPYKTRAWTACKSD